MNFIWLLIVVVGMVMLIMTNPQLAVSVMFDGGVKAVDLALKLWAIYAVWLGILKIVEETGLDKKIAKILSPIIDFLFGTQTDKCKEFISINLTSNILGLGNASIPSGIEAVSNMYKGEKVATSAMIMFLMLNTANLQIIPSTIIGLRILRGSSSPNDIILPTIIVSLLSMTVGVVLVKLCSKIFKGNSVK